VTIGGSDMLYGAINREQLYFDFPDWQQIETEYNPAPDIVNQLNTKMDSISVEIFIGTWCSDSKREVPSFFKIIDMANLRDKIDINIWAVDRNKQLANGLAQKRNIEFVPTFIFYKSNREIGRIIEMPDNSLEKDIQNIIQSVTR
jgi:hypothetical protein